MEAEARAARVKEEHRSKKKDIRGMWTLLMELEGIAKSMDGILVAKTTLNDKDLAGLVGLPTGRPVKHALRDIIDTAARKHSIQTLEGTLKSKGKAEFSGKAGEISPHDLASLKQKFVESDTKVKAAERQRAATKRKLDAFQQWYHLNDNSSTIIISSTMSKKPPAPLGDSTINKRSG
mmetsp:Transcript_95049/g.266105  ORF Transcript_95049/g.266105 Transcript_95049/m.266105 type:complete len:178 (+) Transcript_95049:211-744(+)